MSINLKSIKRESVKSVFSVITSGDNLSRAEISRSSGLSLMTVGKVIDLLEEKKIISQTKKIKNNAGRRAGIVNLNKNIFMAIFDLSFYDFEVGIFDLSLVQTSFHKHRYDKDLSYHENLTCFLKSASRLIKSKGSDSEFMGIAVAIPGIYISKTDRPSNKRIPELNEISIQQLFIETIGQAPLIIEENVKLGAIAHIYNNKQYSEGSVFYIHIGEGVSGAFFVNGNLLTGNSPFVAQLGQMKANTTQESISIEEYMNSDRHTEGEKRQLLINIIHNIIWLLAPHVVIVESDKVKYNISYEDIVQSFDFDKRTFPEVVSSVNYVKNSFGASIKLREMWLEKILFGEQE